MRLSLSGGGWGGAEEGRWGAQRRGGGGEADQPAEIERNNSGNMQRMKWRDRSGCLECLSDTRGMVEKGGGGGGRGVSGCGNYSQETKIATKKAPQKHPSPAQRLQNRSLAWLAC